MAERDVRADILLELGSRADNRLFRNPVGTGWSGEVVSNEGGLLVMKHPRFITYGICPGSADLVGWHSRLITPDDVGSLAAFFLRIEVKDADGEASKTQ